MVQVGTLLDNAVVAAQKEEDDAAELDCDELVGLGGLVDAIVVSTALFAGGADEVAP